LDFPRSPLMSPVAQPTVAFSARSALQRRSNIECAIRNGQGLGVQRRMRKRQGHGWRVVDQDRLSQ
jgi:hypothetical protein